MAEREDPTELVEVVDAHVPEVMTAAGAETPRFVTRSNMWGHPHTHPFILSYAMFDKFGPIWLTWEAETLPARVEHEFHAVLSDCNYHKLEGIRTLHLNEAFWERHEVFTWCAKALTGTPPDFEVMQMLDVEEAAVAILISKEVRDDIPFSSEVQAMLRVLLEYDQFVCVKEPFEFLNYQVDGIFFNQEELDRAWAKYLANKEMPPEETFLGVQIRKLASVHDAIATYRQRLTLQSVLLRAS